MRVKDVVKHFPITSGLFVRHQVGAVQAVDGLTFDIKKGETLGLVGESGCGKSTMARMAIRLLDPTSGTIEFEGTDITALKGQRLRTVRRQMQMIFQDPYASLNPRMTVRGIVGEPLVVWGEWRQDGPARVAELLETVGLNPSHAARFPHEFSGGQRQRIGVARALALRPKLIVCDEPVSALDVSVRAQILNLLNDLQRDFDLTYLFISHDLSVVRQVCDRVAVMYLGKLMEVGDRAAIYERPGHPYTQALLSAVPIPNPGTERRRKRIVLKGDLPSPINPPSGCRFRTRCWKFATKLSSGEQSKCREEEPALIDRGSGHPVACHFSDTLNVL
jgi:peptide/nickel transport system ATP-binding protein/oligopeptide transport system ATP-binding protein